MLLGGASIGPRFIWWNLVSSRRERIEQAKADWKSGRMALPPDDDSEFIPLPEELASRPNDTDRRRDRPAGSAYDRSCRRRSASTSFLAVISEDVDGRPSPAMTMKTAS